MGQELQAIEPREYSVEEVVARSKKIHDVMKHAMEKDHHYGVIPGTGQNRPTLLKPGAELLCMMFRLGPKYRVETQRDGLHIDVLVTCELWHTPTGALQGEGVGSCSTRESKYAYRKQARSCPTCGKEAIIKGNPKYAPKNEDGEVKMGYANGGWLCWKKKQGCGRVFSDNDEIICAQQEGRVENPDIADQYNTVLKMAQKRAMIAAVLNVTAASDIFTQDLEDFAPRAPATKEDGEIIPPSDTNGNNVPEAADQIDRIEMLFLKLVEYGRNRATMASQMQKEFGVKTVAELNKNQLNKLEMSLISAVAREETGSKIPM